MPLAKTPPKPKLSFVQTKIVPVIQSAITTTNIFLWLLLLFSALSFASSFFKIMVVITFVSFIIEKWKLLDYFKGQNKL